MNREVAIAQLNALIEEGKTVLASNHYADGVFGGPWVKSDLYAPWQAKAALALHEVLPEHQQALLRALEEKKTNHTSTAKDWQAQLVGALDAIEQGVIELDGADDEVDMVIERMLNRFPDAVDSINRRHSGRDGFVVGDEYDVQDLLRSICLAYFDDVRVEEAVPSFAGKNSRIDIFLKDEARFIEVKMTRDGLRDKQLGEELSIDIPQYKEHPGCGRSFCFVYDPARLVRNPTGLKRDLERVAPGFATVVIAR